MCAIEKHSGQRKRLMAKQWYYNRKGQIRGPVNSERLSWLASEGKIKPTDGVRRDDMSGWTPAGKVKGLFPREQSRGTPAPSPASPLPATETPFRKSPEPSRARAKRTAAELPVLAGSTAETLPTPEPGLITPNRLFLGGLILLAIFGYFVYEEVRTDKVPSSGWSSAAFDFSPSSG